MCVFNLDHARWPELAANRAGWRAMLQSAAVVPPAARARAAHAHLALPSGEAAARTNAAIDASLRTQAQSTRHGAMKQKV